MNPLTHSDPSTSDDRPSSPTTGTVEIIPVTTPAEQELFLDVPAIVYANDPNWVPPLRSSIAKQFTPDNPFLQYGKFQQFIAVRRQEAEGRGQKVEEDLSSVIGFDVSAQPNGHSSLVELGSINCHGRPR